MKYYSTVYEKEITMPAKTKPKKRGRKLGVKVGPYKIITLKMLHEQLKELKAQVAKHEKVLG